MRKRVGWLMLTVLSALMLIALIHSVPWVPVIRAAQTAASPGDVVINEVAWMGTSVSHDEWIELYNTTEQTITLTGWRLYTTDGTPDITLGDEIGPHSHYLIEDGDDDTISDIPADWIAGFSYGLHNDGERLILEDDSGTIIDDVDASAGWPEGDKDINATMERIDPLASGTDETNWCTNDGVTRNGKDANNKLINGTPKAQNSCYVSSEPAPRLRLVKRGPAAVAPGAPLTYQITVSNTGTLTATHVVITDALPAGLDAIAQTSPYTFTDSGQLLRWDVGTLPTSTLGQITLTVSQTTALTGAVSNVVTATANADQQATDTWETTIVPDVRLYALQPGNYSGSGEAAALINLGQTPVSLAEWCLDDRADLASDTFACFPAGATIDGGQILWLAENGVGFGKAWGFDADWAISQTQTNSLDGKWPGFTDDGEEVYVLDAQGNVVDVLAYGKGASSTGWIGNAVPHPYSGYNSTAQVIYRKLDEQTGLPVSDTDTAIDWAQDPNDPHDGRKIRYPGWDLEALFLPAEIETSAPITVAIAPDASLGVVSQTLAAAQESILIEGYTFESVALYDVISDRLQSGVAVTMLLESNVAGGMADAEKWIVDKLAAAPNAHVNFMDNKTDDIRRYRFQHAKFIVVDGTTALISTDNFNDRSMPTDRLDNGTAGHRGAVVVTQSPGVVARLETLFARDCDPTHHVDVVPYGPDYAPPDAFVPLPQPDWTTYTVVFSQPLVATASHFTVLHAPEHSLRESDALIGLLNQADSGNEIAALQLNEPLTWTHDVGVVGRNPRVQALLEAARRGAGVRLLLDAGYDDPLDDNGNTATCLFLNETARAEDLSLSCRLANVTGESIHAKIFLVDLGDEQWAHVGSINGTETSNKVNREVALQFESEAAHAYLRQVFDHDWARGHGPMVFRLHLPLIFQDYVAPVDYPLLTEVYVNPQNAPGTEESPQEWLEIYHPDDETVDISGWTVGDALNDGDYRDGVYAFPSGAKLVHQQVLVVAACAKEFSDLYGFNPDYEWTECDATVPNLTPAGSWDGFGIALGNTADEVLLRDASNTLVDSVAWGGSVRAGVVPFTEFEEPFPSDSSLSRSPAYTDRDDCNQDFWMDYTPNPREVWAP